jgi:hypothetical protein
MDVQSDGGQIKRPELTVPRPSTLMASSEDQLLKLALCLLPLKNDIPRPTSHLSVVDILNFGPPLELIAVFICSL